MKFLPLLLLFSLSANAATNLAIVNPDATANGKLVSATGQAQTGQVYKTPTATDLVRVDPAHGTWSTAKWKPYGTLAIGEEYEACKGNLAENTPVPGSDAACGSWAYIAKTATPAPPPPPTPINTSGVVAIRWDAPTANTDGSTPANVRNKTGENAYRLYQGTSELGLAALALNLPFGTNTATVNVSTGTWFFAVSAVSAEGIESARSATGSVIVTKTIVPGPPTSIKLTVTVTAPQ